MKGWWYSKLQKVNYFDSQKDIIWVAHALCCALFATPWTVALQAPLSMGILQARILEWVAMPSSRLPNFHLMNFSMHVLCVWTHIFHMELEMIELELGLEQ